MEFRRVRSGAPVRARGARQLLRSLARCSLSLVPYLISHSCLTPHTGSASVDTPARRPTRIMSRSSSLRQGRRFAPDGGPTGPSVLFARDESLLEHGTSSTVGSGVSVEDGLEAQYGETRPRESLARRGAEVEVTLGALREEVRRFEACTGDSDPGQN